MSGEAQTMRVAARVHLVRKQASIGCNEANRRKDAFYGLLTIFIIIFNKY